MNPFHKAGGGEFHPLKTYSTSKCYPTSKEFRAWIGEPGWPASGRRTIGEWLLPELFRFKRDIPDDPETHGYLEQNLLNPMSQIVTSEAPLLTAAQVNRQVEFDRTYRTLVKADGYADKQVILISGINILILGAVRLWHSRRNEYVDRLLGNRTLIIWTKIYSINSCFGKGNLESSLIP